MYFKLKLIFFTFLLLFLLLFFSFTHSSASLVEGEEPQNVNGKSYKAVIIVHGIFDRKNSLFSLRDRIIQKHPGTNVTIIDKLHGWKSLAALWFQVKRFRKIMENIMKENPNGVNLIGYSQGGLVSRGVIQSTDNHNIHNFISLSSPQAGQYGDDFLHIFFPNYVKETAWELFYSRMGQLTSVGNYWLDPHHLDYYKKYSKYLAQINNMVPTEDSGAYKANFLKLKKLVLIGGPDDGIISPWQSSQFSYFDENEKIQDMKERPIYQNDTFGLRTLDEEGRLLKYTIPGIKHFDWHRSLEVIDKYILPHLD